MPVAPRSALYTSQARLQIVDPDSAAFCARLGAVIDGLVPPYKLGGMLVALARTEQGWTQDRLAAEAEMSRSTIARIETGRVRVKTERAAILAAILGIPPDLLETP